MPIKSTHETCKIEENTWHLILDCLNENMIMGNTKYTYVIINRNSGDTYNSWIL